MTLPYELTAEGASDALHEFCAGHTGASFALSNVTSDNIKTMQRFNDWADRIPWMGIARRAEDFRTAHAEGKYLTCGNAQPSLDGLSRDLSLYDEAFELGCRAIMLNDFGMLVDTSHCGHQTTLDACLFSDAPVMANHTGAAAIFNHDRAKSDEEIEAIARTGGIIGVYALPFSLAPAHENPTFEVILDNIDHIVRLVGWQHVAIGTDWPFMTSHHLAEATIGTQISELGFRPEHGVSATRTTKGYEDARDFINFTRGLVSRGYPDEQIKGILGENFISLFERVCG